MPPEVAGARANVGRLVAARATEVARPTATPCPAARPPPGQPTRVEVLAALAASRPPGVHRVDAKLMRLGDWRRTGWGTGGPEPDDEWVWVRARWGEDFEPRGPRRRGVHLTWEASVGSATGGRYSSWTTLAFPPPVWADLPDYSAAGRP